MTAPHQHPTKMWMGRRFGIEMEIHKHDTHGNAISGAMVNRSLSNALGAGMVHGTGGQYSSATNGRQWEVKYDTTCGWEIVTRPLALDANAECEELRQGCDALMALQPKISQQCGLHVHVDVSDFTWKEVQKLLALWTRYEPFFFSMVPRSRRTTVYAKKLRAHTWSEAHAVDHAGDYPAKLALEATTERQFQREIARLGKYNTLRTALWPTTGRVEFRIHSGTVSYAKIRRWVTLLLSMVGRVKNAGPNGTTGRLARTIRPRVRRDGFGPAYMMTMFGLGPQGQRDSEAGMEATREVYEDLMAWIPSRQRKFGHAGSR